MTPIQSLAALVCVALAACNTERTPEKRGPGEGFAWKDSAPARSTPSSPSAPPPARAPKGPSPAPIAPPQPPAVQAGGAIDLARFDKKLVFQDDFDRKEIGPNYKHSGGVWQMKDNAVHTTFAQNKCLWLDRAVPDDAVIEMKAWSLSPRGDIKFTVFGDGHEHETGYTLIMGGWFNAISIIARMDEHGADRKEKHDKGSVKPGQKYHFEMARVGGRIDWYIDGKLYLSYDDANPLRGAGHDRIAFCNWECPLFFDDLRVYSLTPKSPSGAAKAPARGPSASPAPARPPGNAPVKLPLRPELRQRLLAPQGAAAPPTKP